jgi:hypothetical protein
LLSPSPKAGTGTALSRHGGAATEQFQSEQLQCPGLAADAATRRALFTPEAHDDLFATERSGAM